MKIGRVLNKILMIFVMIFLFNVDNVYAADAMICIGGYPYYVESNDSRVDKIIGKSLNQLGIRVGSRETYTKNIDGSTFKITLNGYFYENFQQLNNRCYTYVEMHDPKTELNPNGNKVTTTTYDYTLKSCGSKYDINLNFQKNDKLNNNLVTQLDNTKDKNNDKTIYDVYSSNYIQENGKIKLILKPSENSTLLNVWDRVNVSVVYTGGDKGTCTVVGKNSKNNADKYIKCTDIGPYEVTKDGNKVTNSNYYKIYIYLSGIKTTDFKENVSQEIKQGYVESCGGTNGSIYLGHIDTNIVEKDNIKVSNLALKSGTKAYELCKQLDNIKADSKLKKAYVSECSSDTKTLSYLQVSTLETDIQNKLNNLNAMFGNIPDNYIGLADVEKNGELLCTDRRMGIPALNSTLNQSEFKVSPIPFESKVVYENYDGYWGMICVEDYYIDGGTPSLVKAGTGVQYENKLQVDKTCYITQLKTVQKKPQCVNTSDCNVYYDHGNDGIITNADTNGGPNDSFDSCIKACDGGKYTQQCINSCYKKNYSDDRSSLLNTLSLTNFSLLNKENVKKVNSYSSDDAIFSGGINFTGTITDLPGGYTIEVKPGSYIEDTDNDGHDDFHCVDPSVCTTYVAKDAQGNVVHVGGSSTACNANMYILCHTYSGPPGCSSNAEQEYQNELAKSRQELEGLKTLATQYSQIEDYSISFTDSETGYVYKVSGNTLRNDNSNLNISLNNELSKQTIKEKDYLIGSTTTEKGIEMATINTVYDIKLPTAYVNKTNAEEIVIKNTNPNFVSDYYLLSANKNKKSYDLKKYSKFNAALFTNGKEVFYTSIDSPLYNVLVNSGKSQEELAKVDSTTIIINGEKAVYELYKNKANIEIDVTVGYGNKDKNIGYISFDPSGFHCYYGVYKFLIDDDPDEFVPDDDDGEISEDGEPTPTPTPYSTSLNLPSGIRYYYREIYLEKENNSYGVFPNGRNPRWNWTGTITNGVATGAASNKDSSYIVDPEKLIEDIETKGDSIYTNEAEYDYVFTLTPALMNQIKNYNDSKINNKRITYLDFSLVSTEKSKKNYSQKIKDWYGDGLYQNGLAITDCNNAVSGKCYNY